MEKHHHGRLGRDKERIKREQAECTAYIKRAGSVPAARKLAKAEGRTYSTCDWIAGVVGTLDIEPID